MAADYHSFGNVGVSGHGRLHQGDIHYHYPGDQSQQNKYKTLYDSLWFKGIDSRVRNVERALVNTCMWLRSHEAFLSWKDPSWVEQHKGILWIKGKPGCGKSTILKETLLWAQAEWTDQMILAYFFNARAPEELEKSSLGLYRSLMHQILSRHESIRPLFTLEFFSKEKEGNVEDWQEIELQNFLLKLLSGRYLLALNIFVDALDEGDEMDVQNMVNFFDKAADYARSSGVLFRLCLSSRHYPQIDIDTDMSLVIEDQPGHYDDINTYIDKNLPDENSALISHIRATLLQKSQSIFLWVVLTLSLLKPFYRRGRIKEMRRELQNIPSGLSELFSKILERNNDGQAEFVFLLRWILVADEALSPIQLYHAMHAFPTTIDLEQAIGIDGQTINRYVVDCSRGLIEISKGSHPVVQFIHETVRQFLTTVEAKDYILSPRHPTFNFRPETCHLTVAETCLNYLLHVCKHAPFKSGVLEWYPLAGYAAKSWWRHMQKASHEDASRALDLAEKLLNDNLLGWVQLFDIDKQGWVSDFSLVARDLSTPLYYASCTGISKLCERMILPTNVNIQGGRYGNALQAAIVSRNESVVRVLLDAGADVNAQGGEYSNASQAAVAFSNDSLVQVLLNAGVNTNDLGKALETAVELGYSVVARKLLDAGVDANIQGGRHGNVLQAAIIEAGSESLVQRLIDAGADINAEGGPYGSAIQAAAGSGNKAVVQRLINAGVNVNAQGGQFHNAVQAAANLGNEAVLRALLDAGADVNAEGGEYGSPLRAACWRGHAKCVQILLDAGANLISKQSSMTALHDASSRGHCKIVRILLDSGADTYTQEDYDDALRGALYNGHEEVTRMLMDHTVRLCSTHSALSSADATLPPSFANGSS